MNVTATMAMPIPATMLVVSASPNISVPTNMAVMGSNTPNTEALVAPKPWLHRYYGLLRLR